MKRFLSGLFFLLVINAYSQQQQGVPQTNKTIKGFVVDSISGKPLEYASVAAFRLRDSSIAGGNITNEKGQFIIENLTYGKYLLRITFVGYQQKQFGPVIFNQQVGDILDIGTIKVALSATGLNSVDIVAEKPFIEMNLDKKVVNVEGNVSVMGGNAVDVLQTVPSVSVDMDGNISFRGSENVTILIDGRPANFSGSRKAVLEQIPANMIETIELITNPSAKFDPEGTSGIINIVLKKRKTDTTSMTTTLNYGNNNRYSGNISLSQGFGKLKVFMNYDLRNDKRGSTGTIERYDFVNSVYFQDQSSKSESNSLNHSGKIGAEYYFNDKNIAGFSLNANSSNSESNTVSNNTEKDKFLDFMSNYKNISDGTDTHLMLNGNMFFTKKFKTSGEQLMLDLNYSQGNFSNVSDQGKNYYTENWTLIDSIPEYLEKINSKSTSGTMLGKLDYTLPMKNKQKLETGTHFTRRFMNSSNDYFMGFGVNEPLLFDTLRSIKYEFTEDVIAAYVNISGSLKDWSYSAGLRLEYARAVPEIENDTNSYLNDYYSYYPTAALTRKIKEGEQIQLTYSKRVNRPDFQSLSPFIDYSDSPNLRGGNPLLKPEYIHSIELGYMKIWKTTSFMPSIFYKKTVDLISRFRINYLDSFSLATFRNLSNADAVGLELILNQTITKWWKFNISGSIFQTSINGKNIDPDLTNADFSWSSRANTSIKFMKNMDLQLNMMYSGPRVMAQGKRNGSFFVGMGYKYSVIPNKLTFSLNIRDVLNTQKFGVTMEDDTFKFIVNKKPDSRVVFLGVTWQLNGKANGNEKSRKRNEDTLQEDEMF